nr:MULTISPECIES: TonB-dependent receptor [unclassified Allomuricauda]
MKQILSVFLMFLSVSVLAQQRNVTGTVTDEMGVPLAGATLVVKGTTNGTMTDFDGNYSLTANIGDVISFSFVGMESKEVVVESDILNVTLNTSQQQLDEVVVIGYGTAKKSDLTGAVATVDAQEAYVAPTASLDNGLQGRASGVQVTTANGEPGSSATIRIRGGNSITAGNEPLYVIDGFVGAGDLSTLNPNDIESIQILKDASSTAIYGARGTNGVVLITTKKGRVGKMQVNFKASSGMQKLPSKIDVQTGREFAEFINNADPDPSDGLPFDLNNLPGEETDWQDEMIQTAPMSDYQLSVRGGSEAATYFASMGYLDQEGIVKGTGFERISLRTNVDFQISKVFKAGVNLSLSKTKSDNNSVDFIDLIRQDPRKPVYDSEGNYTLDNVPFLTTNSATHPLAQNTLNENQTRRHRALINTYVQAQFGGFTVKSTFGGDFLFSKQHQFSPSSYPTNIVNGRLASANINRFDDVDLLNENTINYTNTFGDHTISALGGVTIQSQNRETLIVNANEIPSDGVGVNAVELAPLEETSMNSDYSEFSLFSLLGRVDYSYKDKYLITGTIRRDGSSRLGENNRFAIFPSAAVAWKISEEPFLQNVEAINQLKLRASYGVTGNQGIDPFSTLSTFNTLNTAVILNGVPVSGVQQGSLSNPNLKWETTTQYDVALEFSLFNNRLSGEVDFYSKKTEDLLLAAEVPFFTGFTTTIQNVGSLENKGFDVNLKGVLVNSEDFGLTTSLNISTYKNKVLDLGDKTFIETNRLAAPANDVNSQLMVGEPVGIFWGAVYEGIDPATGDAIFADISGPDGVPDGVYSPEYDKTVIGDSNPDFYGGFQTDIRYKNFDLEAFFPFSVGNDNYNSEVFLTGETQINSFASIRENIWSRVNTENASYPRVGSTSFNVSNSYFVQDASFFRLATLQLGYTLPQDLIKGISNFRIYCTGTNLFLIKNKDYWGYDPDVNGYANTTNENKEVLRGFDNINYPRNSSILLGIDVTF